jgi:hypothetical protein
MASECPRRVIPRIGLTRAPRRGSLICDTIKAVGCEHVDHRVEFVFGDVCSCRLLGVIPPGSLLTTDLCAVSDWVRLNETATGRPVFPRSSSAGACRSCVLEHLPEPLLRRRPRPLPLLSSTDAAGTSALTADPRSYSAKSAGRRTARGSPSHLVPRLQRSACPRWTLSWYPGLRPRYRVPAAAGRGRLVGGRHSEGSARMAVMSESSYGRTPPKPQHDGSGTLLSEDA